jgi:hypothetical protein
MVSTYLCPKTKMNNKIYYIFIFLFAFGCHVTKSSFTPFHWLEGKWERQGTKPGQSEFEEWKINHDQQLSGNGITLRNSDTVFVEKLAITNIDQQFYYIADVPGNPSPTRFKITSYSKNEFISENPQHDFPKKITYKKSNTGFTATISGDGKSIDFYFKKVR